jgi:hypothetical protein
MNTATRREALVAIAAGAAAPAAARAADYAPNVFTPGQYRLLSALVDTIIPDTATPGASKAGVAMMFDQDAADDSALHRRTERMLARFEKDDFGDLSQAKRAMLIAEYMDASDERGEMFSFLKQETIDRYYSTEAGLVEELGFKGNTYLAEFPGCQHDHSLEDAD